jgi:MerR family transcriptional regulator, light-induced transcriptional regulator
MANKNKQLDKSDDVAGYRIGAIASLTGITPDALRVWEKRYGLMQPKRTASGNRIYSEDDLARLSMIKSLLDAGDSISKLVKLDIDELKKRVATLLRKRVIDEEELRPCRVVVIGLNMAMRFAQLSGDDQSVQLVGRGDTPEQIETLETEVRPDVVIFEIPTLNESHVNKLTQWINQLDGKHGIVIYRFANKKVLEKIRQKQIILLRAPVETQTVIRHCDAILRQILSVSKLSSFTLPDLTGSIPTRNYDDEKLARIANISTTIKCECPQHLAEIIIALTAFEAYSLQCENQNDKDAALHAYLHKTTAQARHTMESALAHLLEVEKITT